MIEFASKQAEKLFRMQGIIYPLYHAIKADGQHAILKNPDSDKDVGVAMVKAWFELNDVDRYVFFDEAWVIDAKGGIPPLDMEKIAREGLRNHPDRREAVAFFAENRRGEMLRGNRWILRPEHGRASLSPLKIDDVPPGSHSEGRMVGLLKTENS